MLKRKVFSSPPPASVCSVVQSCWQSSCPQQEASSLPASVLQPASAHQPFQTAVASAVLRFAPPAHQSPVRLTCTACRRAHQETQVGKPAPLQPSSTL